MIIHEKMRLNGEHTEEIPNQRKHDGLFWTHQRCPLISYWEELGTSVTVACERLMVWYSVYIFLITSVGTLNKYFCYHHNISGKKNYSKCQNLVPTVSKIKLDCFTISSLSSLHFLWNLLYRLTFINLTELCLNPIIFWVWNIQKSALDFLFLA